MVTGARLGRERRVIKNAAVVLAAFLVFAPVAIAEDAPPAPKLEAVTPDDSVPPPAAEEEGLEADLQSAHDEAAPSKLVTPAAAPTPDGGSPTSSEVIKA